jgi:hypothetical protein
MIAAVSVEREVSREKRQQEHSNLQHEVTASDNSRNSKRA